MRGRLRAAWITGFALLAWSTAAATQPVAGGAAGDRPGPAPGEAAQAGSPSEQLSEAAAAAGAAATTEVAARDPLAPLEGPAQSSDVPSTRAWEVIDWVLASHDNNDKPFIVIDKVAAEVFVFNSAGQRVAASPALVGTTVGDEATPGVGDRELSHIPPKDRKTPAGRFIAKVGPAAGHHDVLWVDYATAISLHAVMSVNKKERRVERLRSAASGDNRITYGCINVPSAFYAKVVKPLFKETAGVVYILPETKPLNEVFMSMPPPLPIAQASR
jgi:hypothetical protein